MGRTWLPLNHDPTCIKAADEAMAHNVQSIDKEGKDRLSFIAFGAGKYRCPGRFFAYHVRSLLASVIPHTALLMRINRR